MEPGENTIKRESSITVKDKRIALDTPKVMGILNLTPDSFYDGSAYISDSDYLNKVEKMLSEGADFIDIGAISTRPGSKPVNEQEELNRLIPALKKITDQFPEAIISADTYRSNVAVEAINSGAHMINDISGGSFDDKMFQLIARLKVPYILMHIKGSPLDMQTNPVYENVTEEIKQYFHERINKLAALGVLDNLVLDPGFGFGKRLEDNYQLLKNLRELQQLGFPLLAGISRKSMINKILKTKPQDALNGTVVANTIALLNGANILRVHDVKEALEAIRLVDYYKNI